MSVSAANGGVAVTSVASIAKAGIQGILNLVNNGDDTIKQLLSTVASAASAALTKIVVAMTEIETPSTTGSGDDGNLHIKPRIGESVIPETLTRAYKRFDALAFAPTPSLAFAAGGLADFTGPAWLDGTKSAPELVLNATDTANFIGLKDILSEILRGSHERAADAEGARGNNYYDIKVEVDSIDSDYGVGQAAERVRELIEEDAMYRNVTAVNKTR